MKSRLKDTQLLIPVFSSEAAEARWLDRHKRQVEREIERRIQEGRTLTLKHFLATSRKNANAEPVTILVASQELTLARRLAAAKGISYQAYLAVVLQQALRREARRRQ